MNNLIIDLHNSCFTSMYDVYIVKVCGCNIYICIVNLQIYIEIITIYGKFEDSNYYSNKQPSIDAKQFRNGIELSYQKTFLWFSTPFSFCVVTESSLSLSKSTSFSFELGLDLIVTISAGKKYYRMYKDQ